MQKVSLIIPVLNQAKPLESTLACIVAQSYPAKEIIVIDGGSTDQTVSVIKKYRAHISYWVSGPDQGISDAFNRGLRAARGDYLYFIGAGDRLWDCFVLENMLCDVDFRRDWLVCGRIARVSVDGKQVLYTTRPVFHKWSLLYKMALPHQALFTSRKYLDQYGLFDLHYKYAMDYELLLRSFRRFPRVVMKNVLVASWAAGGVGQNKTRQVLAEYHRLRQNHRVAPFFLLKLINLITVGYSYLHG